MSQLTQLVKNSLNGRNVSPQVLQNVESYIQRSIWNLLKKDILPPRVWEFTSEDKKQQKTYSEFSYNFYYLPEDFKKLDEFYVVGSDAWFWTGNENEIFQDIQEDVDEERQNRLFTIKDINFDDDTKYEKQLIAAPFPDDDSTVRIKYYVNGKGTDWSWIDLPTYGEAIISEVESILNIGSPVKAENDMAEAISSWKEQKGHNEYNKTNTRVKTSYFGGKARHSIRNNNLEDNN